MSLDFEIGKVSTLLIGDIYGKIGIIDKSAPLIISFSHLGASVAEEAIQEKPSPWAFDYLRKNGFNSICFAGLKGKNKFYRDRDFIDNLPAIGNAIKEFPEVVGYGTSMGAYAAAAFSKPLGITRLFLGSPISTRSRKINDWDLNAGRSIESYNFDWEGPYADAAETNASGYVVYDPLYGLDAAHAKRFSTLQHLKLPGAGHSGFDLLNQIGMMDWVFKSFISGKLNKQEYYERIRARRNIPSYYFGILGGESTNITNSRSNIIKLHLCRKNPSVLKKIPDRFLQNETNRKSHTLKRKAAIRTNETTPPPHKNPPRAYLRKLLDRLR